jgi:FHA domain
MGGAGASNGRVAEDVIQTNGLGLGPATQRFVDVASATGYSVVATGPNRFRLARTYRPMWASVMALATAVFVGLGLFFLLVKRTESGDAVVVEDRTGVKLRLTGALHPQLLEQLHAAFAGAPVVRATPPAASFMPIAARAVESAMPPPVYQTAVTAEPVLTFVDGRSVVVGGGGVLGRNPDVDPRAPTRQLIAIDNPSLSKTHLTFGPSPTGIWVIDHHSTNGTSVMSSGFASPCSPGVRVDIPFGARLVAGEVQITVSRRT